MQDGELYNLGNGVRWGTAQKVPPVKPTNTQIKIINAFRENAGGSQDSCLLTGWLTMGKALPWLCFSFLPMTLGDKGYTVHRVVKVQGGNSHKAFK